MGITIQTHHFVKAVIPMFRKHMYRNLIVSQEIVFKEIITCSYIFINLKCKVLLGLNSRTFTDLFYIDGLNKQSQ